jgi:hypothetical protein
VLKFKLTLYNMLLTICVDVFDYVLCNFILFTKVKEIDASILFISTKINTYLNRTSFDQYRSAVGFNAYSLNLNEGHK